MTTKQFLVNKLSTELSLKGGYMNIAPNSYIAIMPFDLDDESIKYSLSRNWVEVVDKEPKTAEAAKGVKVEITEPYKGLTFEELQVEQAAKAKEKAKAEAEKEKQEAAPEPEPVVITELIMPDPNAEEKDEEKVAAQKPKKTTK